jgi:hypothetical protein
MCSCSNGRLGLSPVDASFLWDAYEVCITEYVVSFIRMAMHIYFSICIRECLLLFGAESFVFQVAIQKLKDQDI